MLQEFQARQGRVITSPISDTQDSDPGDSQEEGGDAGQQRCLEAGTQDNDSAPGSRIKAHCNSQVTSCNLSSASTDPSSGAAAHDASEAATPTTAKGQTLCVSSYSSLVRAYLGEFAAQIFNAFLIADALG